MALLDRVPPHKQNDDMAEYYFFALLQAGVFSIDEDGRIWRHKRLIGNQHGGARYIKLRTVKRAESRNHYGYLVLQSAPLRRVIFCFAHRLVYMHFNGPIPDGLEINHKNGVKDDNRPDNLEAVTRAANYQHRIDVLKKPNPLAQPGEANRYAKLTAEEVRTIRRMRGQESSSALADRFGVRANTITRIWTGIRWGAVK